MRILGPIERHSWVLRSPLVLQTLVQVMVFIQDEYTLSPISLSPIARRLMRLLLANS